MQLNCNNCPWANPETCRSCRAEQAEKAQAVNAAINHDLPGGKERQQQQPLIKDLYEKASEYLARVAVTPDCEEAAFLSLVCFLGQPHIHYIKAHIDEVEWVDPLYGHQN